jgi:hypothetical protein
VNLRLIGGCIFVALEQVAQLQHVVDDRREVDETRSGEQRQPDRAGCVRRAPRQPGAIPRAQAFGATLGAINVLRGIWMSEGAVDWRIAAIGSAESLVPLFLAFGSLTVAWLCVAIGFHRATVSHTVTD